MEGENRVWIKMLPQLQDGIHSLDANMVNWIYRDIILLRLVLESTEEGI